jgi:hypothetical protein
MEIGAKMEIAMYRDLNLRLPENLFTHLEKQSREKGVSLENLCFSLLSGEKQEGSLVDPVFYESMTLEILRAEIRKVIESDLPKEEVRKRVNGIEFQISRRYIR